MKRKIALLIVTASLLLSVAFQTSYAVVSPTSKPTTYATKTKTITVYITRTGSKYHRAGCRYLRQSKIAISLKDAKANGYMACKVCSPPQ